MGLGETIGPGVGAALAVVGLLAPLYLSSALAVLSALTIALFLPEERAPAAAHHEQRPPPCASSTAASARSSRSAPRCSRRAARP